MKKFGFTLIEVIIVTFIILLMAVIAIPAFSKMGERAAFDEKVTEITELIRQAQFMSLNPEQGVDQYVIFLNIAGSYVGLYRHDLSDLIKKVDIPSSDVLAERSVGQLALICSATAKYCCRSTDAAIANCDNSTKPNPPVPAGTNVFDFAKLSNFSLKPSDNFKIIQIKYNPFRVELHQ